MMDKVFSLRKILEKHGNLVEKTPMLSNYIAAGQLGINCVSLSSIWDAPYKAIGLIEQYQVGAFLVDLIKPPDINSEGMRKYLTVSRVVRETFSSICEQDMGYITFSQNYYIKRAEDYLGFINLLDDLAEFYLKDTNPPIAITWSPHLLSCVLKSYSKKLEMVEAGSEYVYKTSVVANHDDNGNRLLHQEHKRARVFQDNKKYKTHRITSSEFLRLIEFTKEMAGIGEYPNSESILLLTAAELGSITIPELEGCYIEDIETDMILGYILATRLSQDSWGILSKCVRKKYPKGKNIQSVTAHLMAYQASGELHDGLYYCHDSGDCGSPESNMAKYKNKFLSNGVFGPIWSAVMPKNLAGLKEKKFGLTIHF